MVFPMVSRSFGLFRWTLPKGLYLVFLDCFSGGFLYVALPKFVFFGGGLLKPIQFLLPIL